MRKEQILANDDFNRMELAGICFAEVSRGGYL